MRYHNITKIDLKNGEGIRTVLWLAGCTHHCKGCQNPITWDPEGGLEFDQTAKDELFGELAKDYVSGITLSGGDPMFERSRKAVLELVKEIKEKFPDKTVWMYTGDLYESVKAEPVMEFVDILVDGEYVEELRDTSLPWVGSSNQRVIDVKKSRESGEVVLHL